MRRFVVDAGVILHLLGEGIDPSEGRRLLAPTLVRSEVLDALYRAVGEGSLTDEQALDRLDRFATMKIRCLGDRVLRRRAWSIARDLGWEATGPAEYVALTQLQADAYVTLDAGLARALDGVVATAALDDLL